VLQAFQSLPAAKNMAEMEQLVQQGTLPLLQEAYACQPIISLHAHCLMRMGRYADLTPPAGLPVSRAKS